MNHAAIYRNQNLYRNSVMAIQSINNVNAGNTAAQAKSASKSPLETSKQPITQPSDQDTVSITTAPGIKKALDVGASAPVVNEARVAEIKAALQAGNYTINPDHVADKMMQLETKIADST